MESTFRITQMSADMAVDVREGERLWTPLHTFVIRADQLTRGDHLAWSPQWTLVQYAIPFGTRLQISTREYGSLILPGGLMVMVSRV